MLLPARLILVFAALAAGVACGGDATTTATPPATNPARPVRTVDAATAGTISGKISFKGERLVAERLRMTTDAYCVEAGGPNPQSDAVLVAADGALQNVFVYIKSGLDPVFTFEAPVASVALDQKGCHYTPRVLGVRTGQTVEVINSDNTLHNVHAVPTANREFNEGLPPHQRMSRTFRVPEVMARFKCDVHNWMTAWVGVVPHPFFAVTGADGAFTLRGVPPGTYEVEAWHEKFGTRTATVTVPASGTSSTSFEFTPPAGTP